MQQDQYLKNVVEAALLAAGRPLTAEQLLELFDERDRPEAGEVQNALKALGEEYAERGIELRQVSSGYRIQIRSTVSDPVSRLWQERPTKYSRAFLETLALIAYRQPITRSEIEEIRGVAVNPNIVRTLVERNWVHTVGYREVPGRPELLGTTREFLDYFNLKSLEDLPTLAALRDMDNVGVQLELPQEGIPPAETPAVEQTNEQGAGDAAVAADAGSESAVADYDSDLDTDQDEDDENGDDDDLDADDEFGDSEQVLETAAADDDETADDDDPDDSESGNSASEMVARGSDD